MTSPTRAIRVSSTGIWNAKPKANISRITSVRYSLTLGSSSIGSVPSPPGSWKLRKNLHATRKNDVIDERAAHDEQHRRREQIGQERLALLLVEAGRDEQPELARDDRKGEAERRPERDAQIGEERLGQIGVDEMPLDCSVSMLASGCGEEIVDRLAEIPARPEQNQNARIEYISRLRSSIRCSSSGILPPSSSSSLCVGHGFSHGSTVRSGFRLRAGGAASAGGSGSGSAARVPARAS